MECEQFIFTSYAWHCCICRYVGYCTRLFKFTLSISQCIFLFINVNRKPDPVLRMPITSVFLLLAINKPNTRYRLNCFLTGKDDSNCFLGTAGFNRIEHLISPMVKSGTHDYHFAVQGSPPVSRNCSLACQGKKADYMGLVSTFIRLISYISYSCIVRYQ